MRYEFQTYNGFLMDTRETLVDAKLHGIGLANDLLTPVTVVCVTCNAYGQPRYRNVAKYKPTRTTGIPDNTRLAKKLDAIAQSWR